MTSEEVDTFDIFCRLREIRHVCEDGGEAVPTTVAKMMELARKGIEARRKKATLSDRNTYT